MDSAGSNKPKLGVRVCLSPAGALALCVLFLLAGCATPATKFRSPLFLPEKFAATGEALLPDQWWLSFNDPRLNSLISGALQNNFNLRIAWDRLAQAEAVARAAGAPTLPSVEGRAAVSHSVQRSEGGGSRIVSRSNLSLGLFAGYEIDLWGRIASRREAAEMDLKATREQMQAAAITLSAAVAAAWYDLAEQQGQLDLLQEQLKLNESVLELVTLRFLQGLTGATDVLQQRQLVESRRMDIVSVEARLAAISNQLAILQGLNPGESVSERAAIPALLPPLPATGVPAALIQRRPDIRAAYYQLLAADYRVAAAVAERFPRISLSASADTSAGHIRDLFSNWLVSLGANLLQPLFDGGARRAEVDRMRGIVSERFNSYGQTILVALGEVEDSLVLEQKQVQLIESLERQLQIAGQVVERTRHSYLYGAMDYLRVLDSLQRHQSLQRQRLLAQRQLIQYRINLYRSLGGAWETERPEKLLRGRTDEIT